MNGDHVLASLWVNSEDPVKRSHARFLLGKPKQEYPSLLEQAKNAVVAAGKAVISGFSHVSKEEQERRLEICYTCEFWDSSQGRCSKCGCFGTFKTWLATQKCPVDKW